MHDKCMQKDPPDYEYRCPWPPRPLVGVNPASLTELCRAAKRSLGHDPGAALVIAAHCGLSASRPAINTTGTGQPRRRLRGPQRDQERHSTAYQKTATLMSDLYTNMADAGSNKQTQSKPP